MASSNNASVLTQPSRYPSLDSTTKVRAQYIVNVAPVKTADIMIVALQIEELFPRVFQGDALPV